MANRYFNQFYASLHKNLTQIDCTFQMAVANGLGITNFKGPGILAAFSHTSGAATSMNGVLNPNPVSGTVIIDFEDTYTKLLGFDYSFENGVTGTATLGTPAKIDNAALVVGTVYVISTLGDATVANWNTVGVPVGITPAVGVTFMAIATQFGAGNVSTSRAAPSVTASTVGSIERLGNFSLSQPVSILQKPRAQVFLQFRDWAGAIVTPLDGLSVNLSFQFVNSSAFTPQE